MKGKVKAKQVEGNALVKKACARREPEKTVEVAKEIDPVDLGRVTVDKDTAINPKLVPGVEKQVCFCHLL